MRGLSLNRGELVTPELINSYFLDLYTRVNGIDPSQIKSLTTGQFLKTNDDGSVDVVLNTSSEQFIITDSEDEILGTLARDIKEILRED